MADTLGPSRETLTNQQLQDLLWGGNDISPSTFEEPIRIGHSLKGPVVLSDCEFLHGLSIQNIRLVHDAKFDKSRFVGDCHFEQLLISKVLSLININGAGATFRFKSMNVSRADTADLWLSFKDKDCIPSLETDNAVIQEMFRRLHKDPTAFLSYNEIREEIA